MGRWPIPCRKMISKAYNIKTVNRSDIKLFRKNPRFITDANRKRLTKGLKEFGLVEPLVWNKRTQHLVSGHQRISILDEQNKKNEDYPLEVAVIDVDEKTEARLVVFLNNYDTQGEYSKDSLSDLFVEFGLNPIDEGFDEATVPYEFNTDFLDNLPGFGKPLEEVNGDEETQEEYEQRMAEGAEAMRQQKREARVDMVKDNTLDTFLVITCSNPQEVEALRKAFNVPDYEQYVISDTVFKKLGITPPETDNNADEAENSD